MGKLLATVCRGSAPSADRVGPVATRSNRAASPGGPAPCVSLSGGFDDGNRGIDSWRSQCRLRADGRLWGKGPGEEETMALFCSASVSVLVSLCLCLSVCLTRPPERLSISVCTLGSLRSDSTPTMGDAQVSDTCNGSVNEAVELTGGCDTFIARTVLMPKKTFLP